MLSVALALAALQAPAGQPLFSPDETCGPSECKGTIDGVPYAFLIGESGEVENGSVDGPLDAPGYSMDDPDRWVVRPERDKVEDTIRWYALHYQTGLMLALTPTGQISAVCVIEADFPGRPIAVRVGTAPAFKWTEDCSRGNASGLRAALLKGGRLITRGYHWPYDYPVDKEGRADNFDKLLKLYAFLRHY